MHRLWWGDECGDKRMKRFLWTSLFIVGLLWALISFPGLAQRGEYDSIVLDFREELASEAVEQKVEAIAQSYGVTPRLNSEFSQPDHVYVLEGDRQLLKALRRSELKQYTEAIEPNYIYRTQAIPNDPDYIKQWNLQNIHVEAAWNETRGQGITVAVIDTGISPVPDLADTKLVPGYDFVNNQVEALDDNGHGTHVAGTIAQSTNNNYGVAGIAYEASLMPIKVLGQGGGGTISDIAEAIRFAADNGADVINLSLGGGGDSQLLKDAIAHAHRRGVVIVAAAGNANQNSAAFPARYPEVIAVSAVDATGAKAPYSNFGAGVDISAPGGAIAGDNEAGGILQNTIDPSTGDSVFRAFQGTSMAAPHVAGVAALIKASGVSDPDAIAQILKESARTIPDDTLNHYGSGYLDAEAAVKVALRGQISVKDFWNWLRDRGYLNLRFWFDGGIVALWPKLAMVVGSYLLAWFLRNYLPFLWSWFFSSGLVMGSAGLFFLQGFYIFDLPQWPFRMMGSSIPELGSTVVGSPVLNPIFASILIPLLLVMLLLSNPQWKWFAIGSALGVASCLAISAIVSPDLLWLGSGAIARTFLITNAILCYGLAYLATKSETQPT